VVARSWEYCSGTAVANSNPAEGMRVARASGPATGLDYAKYFRIGTDPPA
jgi:hypothetical protein